MPAKRKAPSKKGKKKGDDLWCKDDLYVDSDGTLVILNQYLCAAIDAAIGKAEAKGKNLKIKCVSGTVPTKDGNIQCAC